MITIARPAVPLLPGTYIPSINIFRADRQLFTVTRKAQFPNFLGYWRRIAFPGSAHVPNVQSSGATRKGRQFAARAHCPRARVCPRQRIPLTLDKSKSVPNGEGAVCKHADEMLSIR